MGPDLATRRRWGTQPNEMEQTLFAQVNPQVVPDHRALIDHAFILVSDISTASGHRTTRRTYFSLQAASRAKDRATMRGQTASVILCQLVPVGGESIE